MGPLRREDWKSGKRAANVVIERRGIKSCQNRREKKGKEGGENKKERGERREKKERRGGRRE